MTSTSFFAGIELGGTKCICTLASGPGGDIATAEVATTTPAQTLGALADVLAGWRRTHAVAAVGVASFGPVDLAPASARYGWILTTSKPAWSGTDVLGALGIPRDTPVGFDTDVNGAALAEIRWGAGVGLADFAYVTVGTGVGVGLIVDGRPTRGFGHAEMGHLRTPRLPGDTRPSGCPFHDDCVEGLASGTGIAAALGGTAACDLPPDHPVWDRVVHALALLAHALACSTAPRRIVIGGGVVAGQAHLLPRIDAALRDSINGYLTIPDAPYVTAPALGRRAGPLGAIALAADALDAAAG